VIIGILQHIANAREKNVISPLFLEKEPYNISKMEKEPSILNIEYRKWKKKPAPHLARIMHYAMHYATSCEAIVKTSWFELKAQLTGSNSKPNSLIDHNFTR
jgi:hypothetical protein